MKSREKQVYDALPLQFREFFNTSREAQGIASMDGTILQVNRSFLNLTGYDKDELVGKMKYHDLTPAEYQHEEQIQIDRIMKTGETLDYEKEYIHKTGRRIPVRMRVFIVRDEKGAALGTAASVVDLTEHRSYEQTLEKKNIALTELLAQIELEKQAMKRQISANIDSVIRPAIEKIKNRATGSLRKQVEFLEKSLNEIAEPFSPKLDVLRHKLTPREIEICHMIRSGLSTKEIAKALNISLLTIETHRNKIRQKLGIRNKKINLTSYLSTS